METSQYHLSAFFLDSRSPHTMAAPNVGDSSCEVACATSSGRRGAQRGSPAHTLAPSQFISANGCGAPVCQTQDLGLGSWAPGSQRSHLRARAGALSQICSKINVGRERRLLPLPPGLSLIPRAPQLPNTTRGSCSQAQPLGGRFLTSSARWAGRSSPITQVWFPCQRTHFIIFVSSVGAQGGGATQNSPSQD